jgi:hypothetical protein
VPEAFAYGAKERLGIEFSSGCLSENFLCRESAAVFMNVAYFFVKAGAIAPLVDFRAKIIMRFKWLSYQPFSTTRSSQLACTVLTWM